MSDNNQTVDYYIAPKESFEATANAIRAKSSSSDEIEWKSNGFADVVNALPVEVPTILVPDGYTQLEYIQNDGVAYINTGKYWKDNSKLITEIEMPMSESGWHHPFGSSSFFVQIPNTNNSPFKRTPNAVKLNDATYKEGFGISWSKSIHELTKSEYKNYVGTITATIATFTNATVSTNTNSIGIFCRIKNGGSDLPITGMKLYRFQLYEGDMLVQDLIPAIRDTDSVIGVYDIVGDIFLVNASASGSFTGGEL